MKTETLFIKRLSTVGWGLLLIWWGLRWSILVTLPEGSGLLGTSLILLGANIARKFAHLPANPNNTFFGLFSLLSGGILFAFAALHLNYQPPIFETLMVTLGVLLLGYALYRSRQPLSES